MGALMTPYQWAHTDPAKRPEGAHVEPVPLGQVVMTRAVSVSVEAQPILLVFAMGCLGRHQRGDWGDVGPGDWRESDWSITHGGRLLSAYDLPDAITSTDRRLWIITDADRSATTILWPSDY